MLYHIRTDYWDVYPHQTDINRINLTFFDEGGLAHVTYHQKTGHCIVLVILRGSLQWVRVK